MNRISSYLLPSEAVLQKQQLCGVTEGLPYSRKTIAAIVRSASHFFFLSLSLVIGCIREQRKKGGSAVYLDTNLLYTLSASGNQAGRHTAILFLRLQLLKGLLRLRTMEPASAVAVAKKHKGKVFYGRFVTACPRGIQEGLTLSREV